MIVRIVASYAGEIKLIPCTLSYSVEWLKKQLSLLFSISTKVMLIDLEGLNVKDGYISDYVRQKQKTAYLNVTIDFSYSRRIRCSIQYKDSLRIINADPTMKLSSTIAQSLNKSFHIADGDYEVMVDGITFDCNSYVRDSVRYGSCLIVVDSVHPIVNICKNLIDNDNTYYVVRILFPGNYLNEYSIPRSTTDIYLTLLSYCSDFLDISPEFVVFLTSEGSTLDPSSIEEYLSSENHTIIVEIRMKVKDSQGKIHKYTVFQYHTAQSIVTDAQVFIGIGFNPYNCPFIQMPLKLQNGRNDVDPSLFLWDILGVKDGAVIGPFRLIERPGDISYVTLLDPISLNVTDSFTRDIIKLEIPEGALLCVIEEAKARKPYYIVEYDGYTKLSISSQLCGVIPETDESSLVSPREMRVKMDWKSNCPYQLSLTANQRVMISKENSDFYFATTMDNSEQSGWILKTLLIYL